MEFLYRFFPETLIEAIGWTLFHSVWQGALITIILIGALYILNKYPSQVRYLISFLALVILLIWAGITFYLAYSHALEKQVLKKNLISNPAQVIEVMQSKIQHTEVMKKTQPANTQIKWIRFRASLQRNFPVVFMLWLIGVLFFLFRMVGSIIYLQGLRRRQIFPFEDIWAQKILELKEKFGIRQPIEAFQSLLVKIPMALGYLKPILLIPASFFSGLSTSELEAVLAHELAHIKRYDYVLNIIQSIIETLFFFHPAVWLISKSIRNEREHSCDDLAVEITGDKVSYAKALALSQELMMNKQDQYAMTFSSGKGSLLKRVKRLKNHKIMKNKVSEGFIAASLIFISFILVSFTIGNRNLKSEYFNATRFKTVDTISPAPSQTLDVESDIQFDVMADSDSINTELQVAVEELETIPEEMEQLMEIAYTEDDEELALLVLESVNLALSKIDVETIRKEIDMAMQEVDSVMLELDMNGITIEAMEEARREMESEHMEIAEEALRIATETIEAIDINEIVQMAIKESRIALQSIDIEAIQREAREQAEAARIEMESAKEEAKKARKEAEASMEEMERARIEQKEAMKEMKKRMEAQDESIREEENNHKEKYKSMEEQLEELEK